MVQTKDNLQSRHHVYTADHYYSTAASVHPQQHYSTPYKYEAPNPRERETKNHSGISYLMHESRKDFGLIRSYRAPTLL
jgi:hypothetical protein